LRPAKRKFDAMIAGKGGSNLDKLKILIADDHAVEVDPKIRTDG